MTIPSPYYDPGDGRTDGGPVGAFAHDPDALHMITKALTCATDEDIMRALEAANPMALRMVLFQLTSDPWLQDGIQVAKGSIGVRVGLPTAAEPAPQLLRARAFELLTSYRNGAAVPKPPVRAEMREYLRLLLDENIPEPDLDFWWEELALDPMPRAQSWFGTLPGGAAGEFHVVVIGAGMSGVCAAINLHQAGIPYTVLEKNPGIGGTWYENTYPGLRVDLASRAYSYTFESDYPWANVYATQAEIRDYLEHCANSYGILGNMQFSTEVLRCQWDGDARWEILVRRADGVEELIRANAIVSAVGLLNRPSLPDIDGLADFEGTLLHTATWDHSTELAGKKVALVGTGASGVQLTAALAARADRLSIFQRAGVWVSEVPDYLHRIEPEQQWLLDNFPYYVNSMRLLEVFKLGDKMLPMYDVDPDWTEPGSVNAMNAGLRAMLLDYLDRKLGDRPELLAKCIPDWPPLAKRMPKDNGWFDALRRPNVELVTDPIARVTPHGILTSDGQHRDVDVIVVATGFHANRFLWPIEFEGLDGVTLDQAWHQDGGRAYLGLTVPGFPNLFMMYGPNTNGKTGGPCMWGEMQVRYALEVFRRMILDGWQSIEIRSEVYEEFNHRLDEALSNSIWMDSRQRSYYRNDFGRVATNAPWSTLDYWRWTRVPDFDDFHIRR